MPNNVWCAKYSTTCKSCFISPLHRAQVRFIHSFVYKPSTDLKATINVSWLSPLHKFTQEECNCSHIAYTLWERPVWYVNQCMLVMNRHVQHINTSFHSTHWVCNITHVFVAWMHLFPYLPCRYPQYNFSNSIKKAINYRHILHTLHYSIMSSCFVISGALLLLPV